MRIFKWALVVIVALLLCPPVTNATRKEKRRHQKKHKAVKIKPIKFNVVPRVTGGFVIGDAADIARDFEDNFSSKLLYGVGVSFDYYPRVKYAIGFNTGISWKNIPNTDYRSLRAFTYSGSFTYKFKPKSKNSVYFKYETGFNSIKLPKYFSSPSADSDLKFGTHLFIKFALGIFSYTTTSTNTRFEIYYQRIFTDGYRMEQGINQTIDINTDFIAVDLGVGISL